MIEETKTDTQLKEDSIQSPLVEHTTDIKFPLSNSNSKQRKRIGEVKNLDTMSRLKEHLQSINSLSNSINSENCTWKEKLELFLKNKIDIERETPSSLNEEGSFIFTISLFWILFIKFKIELSPDSDKKDEFIHLMNIVTEYPQDEITILVDFFLKFVEENFTKDEILLQINSNPLLLEKKIKTEELSKKDYKFLLLNPDFFRELLPNTSGKKKFKKSIIQDNDIERVKIISVLDFTRSNLNINNYSDISETVSLSNSYFSTGYDNNLEKDNFASEIQIIPLVISKIEIEIKSESRIRNKPNTETNCNNCNSNNPNYLKVRSSSFYIYPNKKRMSFINNYSSDNSESEEDKMNMNVNTRLKYENDEECNTNSENQTINEQGMNSKKNANISYQLNNKKWKSERARAKTVPKLNFRNKKKKNKTKTKTKTNK